MITKFQVWGLALHMAVGTGVLFAAFCVIHPAKSIGNAIEPKISSDAPAAPDIAVSRLREINEYLRKENQQLRSMLTESAETAVSRRENQIGTEGRNGRRTKLSPETKKLGQEDPLPRPIGPDTTEPLKPGLNPPSTAWAGSQAGSNKSDVLVESMPPFSGAAQGPKSSSATFEHGPPRNAESR